MSNTFWTKTLEFLGLGEKNEKGTNPRKRKMNVETLEARHLLSVSPWGDPGDAVGYWAFENNLTNTADNNYGNGVNYGGVFDDGHDGNAITLNGTSDYVSLGDPAALQIVGKITISAWIKPELGGGNVQNIVAKGYSNDPYGEVCLRIANGEYHAGSWDGPNQFAIAEIPQEDYGTWVHLTGVYDGTHWRLYRNGVEIANHESETGAVPVNGDWAIGATGEGTERFFKGAIDEVRIYDHAIKPWEIAELAGVEDTTVYTPVAAWDFTPNNDGMLYDAAGNFNGTLVNGAQFAMDNERGGVLNLSSNDGYVTLGNPTELQITGEITLSAWIKPNSADGIQNIIAKGYGFNPAGEIFLRIGNGEYQVGSWDGGNNMTAFTIPQGDIGEWVHLTGTYDGSSWNLYHNGNLVSSTVSSVGAVDVGVGWTIGDSNFADRNFNGSIAGVQLFNTSVSPGFAGTMPSQGAATIYKNENTNLNPLRVGGEAYAFCKTKAATSNPDPYTLSLDANGHENVKWFINWGDGCKENDYYSGETKLTHQYTSPGKYEISVTAVTRYNHVTNLVFPIGNKFTVTVYEVGELVVNGDFEDVDLEGKPWEVFNGIPGWSGRVEIQAGQHAELDADKHPYDSDQHDGDTACGNRTSITSASMNFIPNLPYTMTFWSSGRSSYAEDNMIGVTVPGTITHINGIPVAQLQASISANAGLAKKSNMYSCLKISGGSVTYSAGGNEYRKPGTTGNDPDNFEGGVGQYKVTSITFIPSGSESNGIIKGSVSFGDVSTDDVVPSYGPLLDNVSILARHMIADIDVNSNNDGDANNDLIDAYDDPIEMGGGGDPNYTYFGSSLHDGTYGKVAQVGETFTADLKFLTNLSLSSGEFDVRIKGGKDASGNDILRYDQPYFGQYSLEIEAVASGTATLTYEIYRKANGAVVASDSVFITVNTPPHLHNPDPEKNECNSDDCENVYNPQMATLAEVFHDANNDDEIITINLNSYFHDKETPDKLTFSIESIVKNEGTDAFPVVNEQTTTIDKNGNLKIAFHQAVAAGTATITVSATDPHGGTCTWDIEVYSVRVIGFDIREMSAGIETWEELEDFSHSSDLYESSWSLLWRENRYLWKPLLEDDIGLDWLTATFWNAAPWADRGNWIGTRFAESTWDGGDHFYYIQDTLGENVEETYKAIGAMENDGEFAVTPMVRLESVEKYLLCEMSFAFLSWGDSDLQFDASPEKPRVGRVGIEKVEFKQAAGGAKVEPEFGRAFPESQTANATSPNDYMIDVVVTLTSVIPSGMKGNVFLKILDPINQCVSSYYYTDGGEVEQFMVSDPTAYKVNMTDNKGKLTPPGSGNPGDDTVYPIVILGGNKSVKLPGGLKFEGTHPGDNFVVAAHPNEESAKLMEIVKIESNEFDFTQLDHTLVTIDSQKFRELGLSVVPKQDMIEVWRTLWVEMDRMSSPHASQPAPAIPLDGYVAAAFADAHILVRPFTPNTVSIIAGTKTVPITRDEDGSESEGYKTLTPSWDEWFSYFRNHSIPVSKEYFWTTHVISAFGYENLSAGGMTCRGQTYIFTDHITTQTVDVGLVRELILTHELGHTFGLPDYKTGFPQTVMAYVPTDRIVDIPLDVLVWNDRFYFSVADIRTIQEKTNTYFSLPVPGP